MKTGNTLRMARNSLLCIFTTLAAGFLVACGSDGSGGFGAGGGGGGDGGPFSAYLVDAPVEGAEYSSPTSLVKDTTRKDGEFEASEGVFEFSVGATTLGSVRLNRDWANSHVTPADFIGVDELQVITIARILQGLDDPTDDGIISISQSARDLTVNLLANDDFIASLTAGSSFGITVDSVALEVPSADTASARLIATRQCLFSGGYMGDYRSTITSEVGEDHLVFEPIAGNLIRVRGVEFTISSDGSRGGIALEGPYSSAAVGVTGNKFFDDGAGNALTFVTPRLVTAIWTDRDDSTNPDRITDSGTSRLTRVAGDPTANRRVVGVETEAGSTTPVGIYVLDYFADDSEFRGQYYDVETDQYSDMLLTVAGGTWPTATRGDAATAMVTLSGTTDVTVQVIRGTDTIGSFGGDTDGNTLDGSWCDLAAVDNGGGSGDVLVRPAQPLAPSASEQSDTEIEVTWSAVSGAMSYKLYRSTSSGGTYIQVGGDISALLYLDGGLSPSTEYFYQLEACNSAGCSATRSPEVSATTQSS